MVLSRVERRTKPEKQKMSNKWFVFAIAAMLAGSVRIPAISDTHSGGFRTVIPEDSGRLSERSDAVDGLVA